MGNFPGRVLVVDDDRQVRDLLGDYLRAVGHEVTTASSGAAALEAVPTFKPDVVVCDVLMPGMSGADVLAALRQMAVSVPVILMSGQGVGLPEGHFAFITKPVDFERLAAVVGEAVARARGTG